MGRFPKIKVIEVSTGLKNQPTYKTITRQFERKEPTYPTGATTQEVSSVNQTSTGLKIASSLLGAIAGLTTVVMVVKEESQADILAYVDYKATEIQKLEVDNEIAAQNLVANEKVLIKSQGLLEELMKNPNYVALQKELQNNEYGVTGDENETNSDDSDGWNPFDGDDVDKPTTSSDSNLPNVTEKQPQDSVNLFTATTTSTLKVLTQEQVDRVVLEYKTNRTSLQKAVYLATGLTKDDPRFNQICKEIADTLKKQQGN